MLRVFVSLLCFIAPFHVAYAADDAPDPTTELELPNPLKTAKAGQWIRYRIHTVYGIIEQTQTLVSIEGEADDEERVLTFQSETVIDGEPADQRTDNFTYRQALHIQREALEDATEIKTRKTTTDFKGQEYEAVEVEFTQQGKRCLLYLSDDIPLSGMIRMYITEQNDVAMELLDFGE